MPDLLTVAMLVVLAVDLALLLALVGLKTIHRRRMRRHRERRDHYVQVLSRHLAYEHAVDPIPPEAADDEAFLDALIDLRNTVTGVEVDKLSGIADRYKLVERQATRLRSRFPLTRRLRAAVSLAELGNDSSAPIMMEHLDDPSVEIRIQAARGLARIGHTPAIDRIVDRLEIEDPWVRARFGDSLAGFGARAAGPLMAYVRVNHVADDPTAVVQALETLAVIGDLSVGPQVAEVLDRTHNPEVEIAAVGALGSVGGSHVVATVCEALRSEDWRVRAKAATSLGAIGDPSVAPDLAAALEDPAWWVRRNAAAALAILPGGSKTLYVALDSPDRYARDAAAEALEDIGELAKARSKDRDGEASPDELRLLSHMSSQPVAS